MRLRLSINLCAASLPLLVSPAASAEEPPRARTPPHAVPPDAITEADVWHGYNIPSDPYTQLFAWIEIVNPDLRVQTPARVDAVDALVVSWPVHLTGFVVSGSGWAGASVFVEPALPTDHLAFRGLSGVHLWGAHRPTNLGLVLEGGGLLATDGHGAFAGGGPAYGGAGAMLSLVARRYFIFGDDRWDFTLDVTVPGCTLVELLGG